MNIEDVKKALGENPLNVDPNEVLLVAGHTAEGNFDKIAKTIAYMRYRVVEKMGRVKAFQKSFPERCVYGRDSHRGSFGTNPDRDTISDEAIIIKAKRLENSKLYETILGMVSSSLFVTYYIDRHKVLNEALDLIFSPDVSPRDKAPFMKLFLEETRKPEEAKGLEINLNIDNSTHVQSVENKLEIIAEKLSNVSADKIIELVSEKSDDS